MAANVVGRRVREARGRFCPPMTQRALAEKLQLAGWDIDRSGIGKIESGIRQVTDVEVVRLARALDVPVSWLFEEETSP
jgi:transcriptional regulator with XRE-family HTH domain